MNISDILPLQLMEGKSKLFDHSRVKFQNGSNKTNLVSFKSQDVKVHEFYNEKKNMLMNDQ